MARVDNRLAALNDTRANAYYHADGNGNVTCLVDTNQSVVARYLFDPFGNTLSATGPAAEGNLYRFSSKELHAPSGLVYYLYRFYDPNLQRWPNRDPISEAGSARLRGERGYSSADVPNVYLFLHNEPCASLDSWGLLTFCSCQFIGIGPACGENCVCVDGTTRLNLCSGFQCAFCSFWACATQGRPFPALR